MNMEKKNRNDGEIKEMEGVEAREYANKNLKKVHFDTNKWDIVYIDEATGERWIMDFPFPEAHGGGTPRLRKIEEKDK